MWTSRFPVFFRPTETELDRGQLQRDSLVFILISQRGSPVTPGRECHPQRSHRVGETGPSGLGVWGQRQATHP